MLRFISALFTLAFLLLVMAFAVANEAPVTLGLWPFETGIVLPLYGVGLGALFAGLVAGGVLSWLAMLPHRINAARLRRQLEKERAEAVVREQKDDEHPRPKFWRIFS